MNNVSDSKGKIRVAIVDDHPVVREGLRAFLQLSPEIEIVGEANDGPQAVSLNQSQDIDVLLMDLQMPGAYDGVEAIRLIMAERSQTRIIVLTSFQDADRMLDALAAGAIGYLQKDVQPDDLLGAIRQAANGRSVLEPQAFALLQRHPLKRDGPVGAVTLDEHSHPKSDISYIEPLTGREQQVLEALAKGMSNKEIAAVLFITEKTVKVHVSHILAKLCVYDRTQAILAAARLGLVHLT